jgi:diguanylate cyclase (GGDEF)-like protein/PAS domain S-box-containing protein
VPGYPMQAAKPLMHRADGVSTYARELEQVLEQIGEAVIVKDLNAIVTYWNREAASLYGFSAQEAVGQPLRKLHAMDLSDADYACLLERIRTGKPTSTTTARVTKSGEVLRVALKTTPLLDAENHLVGEITVARDVTMLHRSEEMVRAAEQRLRSVANSVPALIGYWNRDLVCEFANDAYHEWFGLPPGQIIGTTMRDLLGDRLFRIAEPHARMALKGHPQRFEQMLQNKIGGESFLEVRYIPDRDEAEDETRGFYVLETDITTFCNVQVALETANVQLANNSRTDYLTGLANRRAFREQCENATQRLRNCGEEFGLILLDLDNFKHINDSSGHDTGDDVLRAVAKLLKGQLRNHRDIAARLSGGEFAILCFGAFDEELLCAVAEDVRTQIKQETIRSGHGVVQVTASLGVAIGDLDDANGMATYSRADAALNEAKAAGKDRMVLCNIPIAP